MQGFHSPNLLVVVSEAQGVKQAYFEALKRLQPKKMLLLGNPLSHEGELYESFHAKSDLYHQIAISAKDSPNFRRKRFHVPGLITPADVEERRRDWGDDAPLYIASVLGQFPDALEDSPHHPSQRRPLHRPLESRLRHSREGGNPSGPLPRRRGRAGERVCAR